MKGVLRMNMKTKMLSAFAVVSIITAMLGIYANSIIHEIDGNDTRLYESNTVAIACLASMSLKLQLLQERINLQLTNQNRQQQKK